MEPEGRFLFTSSSVSDLLTRYSTGAFVAFRMRSSSESTSDFADELGGSEPAQADRAINDTKTALGHPEPRIPFFFRFTMLMVSHFADDCGV